MASVTAGQSGGKGGATCNAQGVHTFENGAWYFEAREGGRGCEGVDSVDSSDTADSAEKPVLLIQSGPTGAVGATILGKVPASATAVNREFQIEFSRPTSDGWVNNINSGLREVVDALSTDQTDQTDQSSSESDKSDKSDKPPDKRALERRARVRSLVGAYAALASTYVHDSNNVDMFESSQAACSVTTFPVGIASHVARELVVKHSVIQTASTSARVLVQRGALRRYPPHVLF